MFWWELKITDLSLIPPLLPKPMHKMNLDYSDTHVLESVMRRMGMDKYSFHAGHTTISGAYAPFSVHRLLAKMFNLFQPKC